MAHTHTQTGCHCSICRKTFVDFAALEAHPCCVVLGSDAFRELIELCAKKEALSVLIKQWIESKSMTH
jgi:hypothetical protein